MLPPWQVPIPITEGLDPLSLLTDDADVATWNNQGLPSDRMSTENATILCNTERWPLIVDAQLQGIKWIKNKYGRELKAIRLGQKRCAMVAGRSRRGRGRGRALSVATGRRARVCVESHLGCFVLVKRMGDLETDLFSRIWPWGTAARLKKQTRGSPLFPPVPAAAAGRKRSPGLQPGLRPARPCAGQEASGWSFSHFLSPAGLASLLQTVTKATPCAFLEHWGRGATHRRTELCSHRPGGERPSGKAGRRGHALPAPRPLVFRCLLALTAVPGAPSGAVTEPPALNAPHVVPQLPGHHRAGHFRRAHLAHREHWRNRGPRAGPAAGQEYH